MELGQSKTLRQWELAALMALSVMLCAATWAQGEQAALSSQLVRLHVIAASDSEEEQHVKLQVRDAVVAYLTPELEGARNQSEARELIAERLEDIEQAASSVCGGRSVRVSLSREYYPTRRYEGFSLPAGRYESLRVVLGEGAGHNWWCVVFPPLCLSASQAESVRPAMDSDSFALIADEDGYELRFRVVELWGELMSKFGS